MNSENQRDTPQTGFFDQIEASFSAIATQHKQPHRRLLALNWAAKFHGIPSGVFQKSFELWFELQGGSAQ